jgi:uncharacterized phage infection (PIP) family protein YhgE
VTTSPAGNLPASLSIPLTPAVRVAYQDLYDKIQAELDGTMDVAAIEALNAWQPEVDQVLRKDELCKIASATSNLDALQKQINYTNQGLKTLRDQISSIASHFAMAADIIAAIDKVLTLVPGV